MKRSIAVVLLVLPFSFGVMAASAPVGTGSKPPKKDKTPATVKAPEIDAAAGSLAVALAGGGLALLARSRRKQQA